VRLCRPLLQCDRDEARSYWHYSGTTSRKDVLKISHNALISLAHLGGFEPLTPRFVDW
jgi:hypothetical protein